MPQGAPDPWFSFVETPDVHRISPGWFQGTGGGGQDPVSTGSLCHLILLLGGALQSHQGRSLNIKVTDQHWDDSSVFGIAWFRKYLVAKNYCVVITATECVFALFIATASVVRLKNSCTSASGTWYFSRVHVRPSRQMDLTAHCSN